MADPSDPVAILVVGSAGSGKSTVARGLARDLRAAYLDKDSMCGPLAAVALIALGADSEAREGSKLYRDNVMPAEYASLFAVAADNLRNKLTVVIDAPFAAYLDDANFLELAIARADWPPARVAVLRVSAPEESTRRRLITRGLARDVVKLNDWAAFWAQWGTVVVRWAGVPVLDFANEETPAPIPLESLGLHLLRIAQSWRKST
jgi:predicted kinase